MKTIHHSVLLGYPDVGEGSSPERAILTVSADEMNVKPARSDPVTLNPDEVVGFKLDPRSSLFTQVLVVEHVAYNKIGNCIFYPTDTSARGLMEEINAVGFRPKAKPGIPWEPGQSFPLVELGEEPETAQPTGPRDGVPAAHDP